MILPIGHHENQVRRLPWVTFGLIASCIVVFLATDTNDVSERAEARGAAAERAASYWREHAHLDAPGWVRDRVAFDVMPSQRQQYLEALPHLFSAPPATPEERARQQSRLDRWVDLAEGLLEVPGAESTLFERHGVVPSQPRPHAFLTYMFLHAGWMHLIGNLFLLFLAGPPIEDRFGRVAFASFYLGSGVFAAIVHSGLSGASTVPMVGASGAIAGVLGAFAVRLWGTKIRFAYFFWILFRFLYGTFEAPAWAMLSLWFANELFQAWLWGSIGLQGGVAYWCHVGGFVCGVGVAFALRAAHFEERFIDPSVEAQITKFTANPVLEQAMEARERGDAAVALELLEAEWQRSRDEQIALAFWDAALACAEPERATEAFTAAVTSSFQRGETELALRHWSELSDRVPDPDLPPSLLLRFVPPLLEEHQRARASTALRQAVASDALTPGLAQRAVEMARDLDPAIAVAAARRALASPDLHAVKRERLEALVRELGGGASSSSAPLSASDAPSGHSPTWGDEGAIELSRFGSAKLTEAVPLEIGSDGLRLRLSERQEGNVGWECIQAIAAGVCEAGLGDRPVLVIDLLANWNEPEAEVLHGVRLRSDRFDPRPLLGFERGDARRAFGLFVGRLLERSGAIPLPTAAQATGGPFERFDAPEDYARIVLEVAE